MSEANARRNADVPGRPGVDAAPQSDRSAGPGSGLTHFDTAGRARMVDVGAKPDTAREAVARGRVLMGPATLALIEAGRIGKGDVLGVAQVAGIMGAKRTPDLIPMCHPLLLAGVELHFTLDREHSAVEIEAAVRTVGKTGAEMEALTAVATAALTIYDMCKAVDREMAIEAVRLVYKSGGKSGTFDRRAPLEANSAQAPSRPAEPKIEAGGPGASGTEA